MLPQLYRHFPDREPDHVGPPPRKIRLRTGKKSMVIGGLKVLLIIGWPPVIATIVAIHDTLIHFYGVTTSGYVTKCYPVQRKTGAYYRSNYRYQFQGKAYFGHMDFRDRIDLGTPVTVKLLPATPNLGEYLVETELGPCEPSSGFPYMWGPTIALYAIYGLFWWGFVIAPLRECLRERFLIMHGYESIAVITSRTPVPGYQYRCTIEYRFNTVGGSGGSAPTPTVCSQEVVMDVNEGDSLTIVYDPRDPSRNLVYKFSEYEVVR
jgi:hypothetical protein